ncbi:unnamed protein product [Lactuca virosa]|uniref:RRM domain-containing protein n=1 Tax=Lactuca virosa TaxID=75947 RepID=A0AAU9PUP7_9ASTR|nr:unnamed protein product [Lactuca virosa]
MAYGQHYRSPFGDTTFRKVFVGGLAWETPVGVMRTYFEQFGHILEAVIITDKITGKSKGYGFVTYEDAESAKRACDDPNPVIDGRKANCNIASHGRNQGSSTMTYSGAGSPVALLLPPQPPSSVMYPPYGYATYPPEYAYHQAMYNSAMQHAYYGPTSAPYYYGQSPTQLASPRGALTPQVQRLQQPSYMYYPTQPMCQVDYPTPPPPVLVLPPRQPVPSPSPTTGSDTPRNTTEETDDATISPRTPNT